MVKKGLIYLGNVNGAWGQRLCKELGASFQVLGCPLDQMQAWTSFAPHTQAVLLNLDELSESQGQTLDRWSMQAWRSTFNDFILRAMTSEGPPPLLLAFSQQSTWENAKLAVQVGAREICEAQNLVQVLQELFASPVVPTPKVAEVFALPPRTAEVATSVPAPSIPKHAIPFPIEGLEGQSLAIETVRNLIRKSAPLDTSVLILGATGTGKERVARCLHRYSARAKAPFVAVNCGALSPQLVEAELFGHVAGAFTGALTARDGYFRAAHGGTLFLDEISELPLDVQVKILRVLQEKAVTPVGSSESIPVDVRLISASATTLEEQCHVGKFREDLLYRIRVMEIQLPSLIERRADIADLSKVLLKKLARHHKRPLPELSEAVLEKFLLYNWPGNIRELENGLEHGATLAWAVGRNSIQVEDLPPNLQYVTMKKHNEHDLKEAVRRFEREYIASTLRRLGGSKEESAEALGLSLATLYRKMGGT